MDAPGTLQTMLKLFKKRLGGAVESNLESFSATKQYKEVNELFMDLDWKQKEGGEEKKSYFLV